MDLTPEELASKTCPMPVYDYLNQLRRSGVTNMFGAASYIEDYFEVNRASARQWLMDWMHRFNSDVDS
jgi:hypothetical protein